jgi:hypothetical protein
VRAHTSSNSREWREPGVQFVLVEDSPKVQATAAPTNFNFSVNGDAAFSDIIAQVISYVIGQSLFVFWPVDPVRGLSPH